MASRSAERRPFLARYRTLRWAVYVVCVSLAGTPFAVFFVRVALELSPGWRSVRPWMVLCVILVAAAVCLRWAHWRVAQRLRRVLQSHSYHVCLGCGYTLNPEHAGRPCPECGRTVDLVECTREWRKFLPT